MPSDVDDEVARLAAQAMAGDPARAATTAEEPAGVGEAMPGIGDHLPLREVVASGGYATLAALAFLNVVDNFDDVALRILAPDIIDSLGLSTGALASLNALKKVFTLAGSVFFGVLADRWRRRPQILAASVAVWTLFVILTGLARTGWQLAAGKYFTGVADASGPVVKSLLADQYPIEGRNRVYAIHHLAQPVGSIVGPLVVGGIAVAAGGPDGWRWAFLLLAVPGVALTLILALLRDPDRGGQERAAVLGEAARAVAPPPRTSVSAAWERLKKIDTYRRIMVAIGIVGVGQVAVPIVFNVYLEDRFGLNAGGRGIAEAVGAAGLVVGLAVGGVAADRRFKRDPEGVVRVAGLGIVAYGVLKPVALFLPHVALVVAAETVVQFCFAAMLAPMLGLLAAVVPPRLRGMGFALHGVYGAIGGVTGSLVLGMFSDAFGERTALLLLLPPACALGGAVVLGAAKTVRRDVAAVVREIELERSSGAARSGGVGPEDPLLEVTDLDFSYGPLQVLFGVNLEVRRGEVLALLGTNGAGKSTLLRAVSGLDIPERGTIRYDGHPVTFVSAEERVAMGIVQVRGGQGVFPSLSVRDNLLCAAHTYVWDTDEVRRRAADVLAMFPVLATRLDQPASTLSGGEQQMLAIAKALMLRPRLLLIDELSLGLAPSLVQQLLDVTRRLRDEGVTIVLVEQSVNVALTVAERAVFMEKGQVRFEGAARDLLDRDDLLRAVFLGDHDGQNEPRRRRRP